MTASTTPAPVRDFNYIKSSGRRLSEYEAVSLYGMLEQGVLGTDGWFVLGAGGRAPVRAESTRLVHPNWFAFRDSDRLWQRTHTRKQAEQERAIQRVTEEAIAGGRLGDIDKDWLEAVIGDHYRVWSYAEYGAFKPWAAAQREALSDTLTQACVFQGLDRLRHAQDIVVWLLDLETNVPGFKDEGSKERWTGDACYQPARRLIERLMYEQFDWGELILAVNLVVDPLLTEVAVFQLVGRNAPFHGDPVTSYIVSTAERDRRWSLGLAQSLVKMVLADDAPAAAQNRATIQEWLETWSQLAREAATGLAGIYDKVPRPQVSFEQAMAMGESRYQGILEGLGLKDGGTR